MSDGVSKETKAVMQTARRKATDQGIWTKNRFAVRSHCEAFIKKVSSITEARENVLSDQKWKKSHMYFNLNKGKKASLKLKQKERSAEGKKNNAN